MAASGGSTWWPFSGEEQQSPPPAARQSSAAQQWAEHAAVQPDVAQHGECASSHETPPAMMDHMRKSQHMTRVLLQSTEENLRGDMNTKMTEEREARTRAHQDFASRLDRIEAGLSTAKSTASTTARSVGQDIVPWTGSTLQEVTEQVSSLRGMIDDLRAEVNALRQAAIPGPPSRSTSPKAEDFDAAPYSIRNKVPKAPDGHPSAWHSDFQSLRDEVDHKHKDTLEQINSLRITAEQSAVRAGFLAVAASECAPQDKAWLFNKLKAREDSLSANNSRPSSVKGYNGGSAGILDVTQRAKAIADKNTFFEFEITLDKTSGGSLGITIDGTDNRTLLVEKIDVGLIQNWNKMNSGEKEVRPNDRIVACNGKRGESQFLAEQASKSQVLILTIQRARGPPPAGAGEAALARFDGNTS